MEPMRLSKYLSACGVLSRRAADCAIRNGGVLVNGAAAAPGQEVLPGRDVVVWNGREVRLSDAPRLYVMLNKPRGFVTTLSDDRGRPVAASLVRGAGARLYPVGRLDMDSDGLLLFTNDGDFANRVTHPGREVDKVYLAYTDARPTEAQLAGLARPIPIDGRRTAPASARVVGRDGARTVVEVTIHDGRNRQVRRLFDREGLRLRRLTRVAEGPVRLGNLGQGRWRFLTAAEVAALGGRPNGHEGRDPHAGGAASEDEDRAGSRVRPLRDPL